ncbi:uncharacterized protein B0I36DRAFT_343489 [Microdochium trichocladiopsis]|uniref:Molybdate-anion transporter n=1 Tax=Microdochium trichocladiopsis TaxID=1682393 RepID=A0A9P9BVE0_9PEZI|nr:uncharacterized protein B0I36DRAFT_343489 [Microdochium trichocladiopsis]KAH7039627.1 hypothetical protein B0I36DRAFT_343489 [Microdochium trichocladiopsis]
MDLDMYWMGLAVLGPMVLGAIGHGVVLRGLRRWRSGTGPVSVTEPSALDAEASRFRTVFLRVYLTVMASEWLQGPYIYSLFRHEKSLSEWTVALLFVTYYTSAAISAPFTGCLADRFGRRAACLSFCAIHSLASITAFFDSIEILVAGRVLGGFALTLLWTAFESWMVAEYNARGLEHSSLGLPAMFGAMTTSNCITGILAGILGHCIVLTLGSKTDPFALGVLLNVCAVVLMLRTWNENRGVPKVLSGEEKSELLPASQTLDAAVDGPILSQSPSSQLRDYKVWVLSFVSCCFEGTMFLLVFFWPSALQGAHDAALGDTVESDSLPHGVIQAAFMASMVLGAILFNTLTGSTIQSKDRILEDTIVGRYFGPTSLMCTALVVGSVSFLVAAFCRAELHMFGVFLALELCSGIFIPSMALHRSIIVSDKHRTGTYGIMKIPLFLFVVGALCTTTGADRNQHQQRVFLLCSGLLLLAAIAAIVGLRGNMDYSGQNFTILATDDLHEAVAEDYLITKSRVCETTSPFTEEEAK